MDEFVECPRPVAYRTFLAECPDGVVDAVEQLREPAGKVDVAAVDVVEGQRVADPGGVVLHGDAEQQPVDRNTPGVLPDAAQSVVAAMVRVQPPAGAGGDGPITQPLEIVLIETESPAYRAGAGEIEHLGGRDPTRGELEQP